jgi:hypothetical protein
VRCKIWTVCRAVENVRFKLSEVPEGFCNIDNSMMSSIVVQRVESFRQCSSLQMAGLSSFRMSEYCAPATVLVNHGSGLLLWTDFPSIQNQPHLSCPSYTLPVLSTQTYVNFNFFNTFCHEDEPRLSVLLWRRLEVVEIRSLRPRSCRAVYRHVISHGAVPPTVNRLSCIFCRQGRKCLWFSNHRS